MSTPTSRHGDGDIVSPEGDPTATKATSLAEPAMGRFAGLAAAAAAALIVWGVVQTWYPFFAVPTVAKTFGRGPSAPSDEELALAARLAYSNAMALVALAGGVFAAAIALTEAIRRRSAWLAVVAALIGAVLGGAAGVAGGWCGQRFSESPLLHQLGTLPLLRALGDMPRAFVIQAICWGQTGLGIGLGLAIPLTRCPAAFARSAARGALGGLLCAFIYPMITALVGIFLPVGETGGLVPDVAANRFLWLEAAAICIAISIAGGASRRHSFSANANSSSCSTRRQSLSVL